MDQFCYIKSYNNPTDKVGDRMGLSKNQKDKLYPYLRKCNGIKLHIHNREIILKTNSSTLSKNSDPANTKNTFAGIKYMVNNALLIPPAIENSKYIKTIANSKPNKTNVLHYHIFTGKLKDKSIEIYIEERKSSDCYLYNINVNMSEK